MLTRHNSKGQTFKTHTMNHIPAEFLHKPNVSTCRANYRNTFKHSNKYLFINHNS